METFWFFRLRFRRAYDTAYDSDFRFSLGHKLSYDSDSVASENQPLEDRRRIQLAMANVLGIKIIFYVVGWKIRYKNVLDIEQAWKAVSFPENISEKIKNTRAVSTGSRARLNQTENWS